MENKLYLLIDPTQPTYDKVMTFKSAYQFAIDIAEYGYTELLKDVKDKDVEAVDNRLYKEHFMLAVLEMNGYIVQVFDDGIIHLEDYISDLKDIGREIG